MVDGASLRRAGALRQAAAGAFQCLSCKDTPERKGLGRSFGLEML